MKIEVILLGKNHYDMDGNRGASVVVFGNYEKTNNKEGISISNASIDYLDHENLTVFPGRYHAKPEFTAMKNRSGKEVTALKLTDLTLIEELTLKGVK